ncbi:hypothetical protein L596_029272 [Steinernema carpocapsae]|uniref:Uncharacterized protein n=1 Tax=Steinernema carpocapsae TaxID=34508 RepID=A0A4U5LU59_STECR|nr:hypothetical protein L596_029272 [Steinernema carpocapsae]
MYAITRPAAAPNRDQRGPKTRRTGGSGTDWWPDIRAHSWPGCGKEDELEEEAKRRIRRGALVRTCE